MPPAQQHLGGGAADASGDVRHDRVGQTVPVGQRAVRLDDDPVARAESPDLALLEERADLDLVHGGHHRRLREQLFEVVRDEVADADRAGAFVGEDSLQRAPGIAGACRGPASAAGTGRRSRGPGG